MYRPGRNVQMQAQMHVHWMSCLRRAGDMSTVPARFDPV